MNDEVYVPPEALRISVDTLERELVSQFILYPIAMVRKRCPWFQRPIVTVLRPDKGKFFLNHWLTDYVPKTGYRLRRHVVGLRQVCGSEEIHSMVVISPDGQITITPDENTSYEGE